MYVGRTGPNRPRNRQGASPGVKKSRFRVVPFDRGALIAFVQASWPLIEDDPEPARWAEAFLDSTREEMLTYGPIAHSPRGSARATMGILLKLLAFLLLVGGVPVFLGLGASVVAAMSL